MPFAKSALNGFTAQEVHRVTGVSVDMLNYLAREQYLTPTYARGRIRGRVRYYSYRDLVVARIVQRLRECGLELRRLKAAIRLLSEDRAWLPEDRSPLHLLATDGRKVYLHQQNGSLVELTKQRQQTFAFVVDTAKIRDEVKARIKSPKRERFDLKNLPLQYADQEGSETTRSRRRASRSRAA